MFPVGGQAAASVSFKKWGNEEELAELSEGGNKSEVPGSLGSFPSLSSYLPSPEIAMAL